MITIFNRKEVCCTLDAQRQARIREVLSQNNIEYTVKVHNTRSSSAFSSNRAYTGSLGEQSQAMYEYEIYVKKDAYDRAMYLIHQIQATG